MNRQEDDEDIIASVMASSRSGHENKKVRVRRKRNKIKLIIVTATILLVTGALLVLGIYLFSSMSSSPLEGKLRDFQDKTSFTLYVPTMMPEGYIPELDKVSSSDGVVFVTIVSSDGTKPYIYFNQQAIPPNAKIEDLLGSNAQPEPVKSNYGNMYLTSNESSSSGILVTDDSWVIFSGEKSIGTDTYLELAANLKPLK
jgi:hypothetical protein